MQQICVYNGISGLCKGEVILVARGFAANAVLFVVYGKTVAFFKRFEFRFILLLVKQGYRASLT